MRAGDMADMFKEHNKFDSERCVFCSSTEIEGFENVRGHKCIIISNRVVCLQYTESNAMMIRRLP